MYSLIAAKTQEIKNLVPDSSLLDGVWCIPKQNTSPWRTAKTDAKTPSTRENGAAMIIAWDFISWSYKKGEK